MGIKVTASKLQRSEVRHLKGSKNVSLCLTLVSREKKNLLLKLKISLFWAEIRLFELAYNSVQFLFCTLIGFFRV